MAFGLPFLAYGTPRKLPKAQALKGRVVVLDIAFAADAGGARFEKVTRPFIEGLGERLVMWVDHHDHVLHSHYNRDPRFVLRSKAQHGACPEMITPELVERAGQVDTICCHVDFDGLCSAAKWILDGIEPYSGADDDARAIDTRIGRPSELGAMMDRALRARPKDNALRDNIVAYLVSRCSSAELAAHIRRAADALKPLEAAAKAMAKRYQIDENVALIDVSGESTPYDKTWLLLLGQELAPISVVYDQQTVTAAAKFDSGIDLVKLLGLSGGMPTRVSVSRHQLHEVLELLKQRT